MINATPIRPLNPTPDSSSASGVDASSGSSTTQPTNQSTPPATGTVDKAPTPKKKFPLKYILGGLFLLLLLVGGGAGMYLMRMSQDVRQQAYGGGCSVAGAKQCVDGKNEVCDGNTWRPTNESCTAVSATPSPPSACNPATHCCNPGGCTYKTWVKQ